GFVLGAGHKLLAVLIGAILVAGVITIFVKSGKTTETATPRTSPTFAVTVTPSASPTESAVVSPTPTTTVSPSATTTPSQEPSPTNTTKTNPRDDMGNTPPTPVTGVSGHPIGLVFLTGAIGIATWVGRASRA
ncbi:MAG: hypothetical protein ACXVD2_09500, partial [Actinomycetota bacterium]